MAAQKSKAEIITRLQTERRRLENNLAGLDEAELTSQAVVGEWTIKDVLAHLAEWEARMPQWVAAARSGQQVINPDEGLTWKQLDEFNRRVYLKYRDWPLAEVQAFFHSAHQGLLDMTTAMPDEELLFPGFYTFTGKGAVYDWLSQYAAHDRWAKTAVLHWKKSKVA